MSDIDIAATYMAALSRRARRLRLALPPGHPGGDAVAALVRDLVDARAVIRRHGGKPRRERGGLAGRLRDGPPGILGLVAALGRLRAFARRAQIADRNPYRRVFWRSVGDAAGERGADLRRAALGMVA